MSSKLTAHRERMSDVQRAALLKHRTIWLGSATMLALSSGIFWAGGCGGDADSSAYPTSKPSKDGGATESGSPDAAPDAACSATSCAKLGAVCGTAPDGCGGVIDCGACPTGTTCGGNGANKCGTQACSPRSCAQMGASCGYVSDGCSQALYCGDCAPPLTCGGAGVANACGHQGNAGSGGAPGSGGSTGNGGAAGSGGASGSGGTGGNDQTWCTHDIDPATGFLSTVFDWKAASNGTSCEWTLDNVSKGPCECSWVATFLGSDVGIGTHTATLHVTGPSGQKDCSAIVTVKDETWCKHTVAPVSGYPSTTFTWDGSSNGTACEWTLDGVPKGSIECNFSATFLGSDVGIGKHSATLHVLQGPSGAKDCALSFEVLEETWCTHTVTPKSGSLSTSFAWEGASNGTECEWSLDGVPRGTSPCNFSATFLGSDVGVGAHTAVLQIVKGPSGPKNCPADVTVY